VSFANIEKFNYIYGGMWRKQLQVHLLKPKLVSNSELNIPNSRNIKPFKCILNLVRFVFAICMKTFIDHSEILSLERTHLPTA